MIARLLLVLGLTLTSVRAAEVAKISPAAAAQLVAAGKAVLVDVREPGEWRQTGVAAPAVLLPKSEFDEGMIGDWPQFLAHVDGKEIILYCHTGRRAGMVGAALAAKGLHVANAGGFQAWQDAGLPVRPFAPGKP